MNHEARRNLVHNCPLTATWAAVGGKWKLTIIYWLGEQPRHFAALRRQLDAVSDGISEKVLSQQLSELMVDGIVTRQPTGAIPAPVVYSLSKYGRSTLPMLEMIRIWGVCHLERLHGFDRCATRKYPSCLEARASC